jgi:hypothetical protein
MSALAMLLTVAIVVPGDGPEKRSMEVVEMMLDLSGEWEGTVQSTISESKASIKISRGRADIRGSNGFVEKVPLKIIEEGEGKLRMEGEIVGVKRKLLGIYKWQGNRLVICCRVESKGRPTSFMVDGGNKLLILHRPKPRK